MNDKKKNTAKAASVQREARDSKPYARCPQETLDALEACAAAYYRNAVNAGNSFSAEDWAKAANCVRRIAAIWRDGRDTPETRAMVRHLELKANGLVESARFRDGGYETMKWVRKADGCGCAKFTHTIAGVLSIPEPGGIMREKSGVFSVSKSGKIVIK